MNSLKEKAKKIRLLILDVDGILTSGELCYLNEGMEMKKFHIHDGLGIKLLQKAGIPVGIISAKKSEMVERRLNELNVTHYYLNCEDKLPPYQQLKKKLNLTDEEIAYMGDDLPDLPVLRKVGFAITVPEAPLIIKNQADYITHQSGGKGAVREICEFILQSQDRFQTVIECYLQ